MLKLQEEENRTEKRLMYSRVLLKLSGEALSGDQKYGIHPNTLEYIAKEIRNIVQMGVETCIVVGGGNIFRGVKGSAQGMDRSIADYIGMLATIMNAISLQDALEKLGMPTRVQTAIEIQQLAEPFIMRRAIRHIEKGRVVIFAGGTGNPYFTTDTAAALRATEMGADVVLKATQVDGVYTKDPLCYPDAEKLEYLSYLDVLNNGLKVMDATAVSLCMENIIPIVVLNIHIPGNMERVLLGEPVGTRIGGKVG